MNETVRDTTNKTEESVNVLLSNGFEEVFSSKYAAALFNKEKHTLACVVLADYIPIQQFKETFEELSKTVQQHQVNRFIFDKRALRTFHQPSMEWYYIEWKTNMLKSGLKVHRKILPDLQWFVKAVEIAKKPLLKKMPEEVRNQLDIGYCDSIREAIVS